ncbi:hypothetical protein CsSME_00000252 [Camellia sinensis var. sinensis]
MDRRSFATMEAGLTMGFLFSVGFPQAALVVFLVGETERGSGGETAMDWNLITNSRPKSERNHKDNREGEGRKKGITVITNETLCLLTSSENSHATIAGVTATKASEKKGLHLLLAFTFSF